MAQELFETLWFDYWALCPQAQAIHGLLSERGERIVNDHIALRTFDEPGVSVQELAAGFEGVGYRLAGRYHFEKKHLDAIHLEPPVAGEPKVFISGLLTERLPTAARRVIHTLVEQAGPSTSLLDAPGRPWQVTVEQYRTLVEASEYAGWLAAFGFRANHFTILVNELETFSGLCDLNEFLVEHGFELNEVGGQIKGDAATGLAQSSTVAPEVDVEFADGTLTIPGCYYEFAERFEGTDGQLFQGFVTESADKIFHSTDRR